MFYRPKHPKQPRKATHKKPLPTADVLLAVAGQADGEGVARCLQGFFFDRIDGLATVVATPIHYAAEDQKVLAGFVQQLAGPAPHPLPTQAQSSPSARDHGEHQAGADLPRPKFVPSSQMSARTIATRTPEALLGRWHLRDGHWLMTMATPAGSTIALTWRDSYDPATPAGHRQGTAIAQVVEAVRLRLIALCAHAALGRLAYIDPLTGLGNSRQLRRAVADTIHRANRFGGGFTLLFVDLDNFKLINDSLGHDAGDRVLIQTARSLTAAVRSVDQVFRLAGDEFVIVLAGADSQTSEAVVSRIREALAAHETQPTCSVGIASYPCDGHTFNELLKVADQGMYRCKRGRREPPDSSL